VGLTAITGVLSRYFIVGFFMPAYVALVGLWLSASRGFIPNTFARHSETTQLLILGGVALVVALLLSGLSYPLTRTAEGYPLLGLRRWPVLRLVPRTAIALQGRARRRLEVIRNDTRRPDAERARAYAQLDKLFPCDPNRLLPTRLGNAMRAYEGHSNVRWGLDGVTIWPRIAALLSAEESDLLTDAEIDLRVFLNGAFAVAGVGACLIVDKVVHDPNGPRAWPLYVIPFIVAYLLYRASIGAAVRRGAVVRASIDLHRFDLYAKLGIRDPTSLSDERTLSVALCQFLLYGRPPLADDLWRGQSEAPQPDIGDEAPGNERDPRPWVAVLKEWIRR